MVHMGMAKSSKGDQPTCLDQPSQRVVGKVKWVVAKVKWVVAKVFAVVAKVFGRP